MEASGKLEVTDWKPGVWWLVRNAYWFSLVGPELEAGMKTRGTVSYWPPSDNTGPLSQRLLLEVAV